MKTLKEARRIIESNMVKNGTMGRIDTRKEKHNRVALEMGYSNAQEAFNELGQAFLIKANV